MSRDNKKSLPKGKTDPRAAKRLVFNKDQLFLWLVNTNCGGKNLLLACQLHQVDKRQEAEDHFDPGFS